jgi:hypothetical protein
VNHTLPALSVLISTIVAKHPPAIAPCDVNVPAQIHVLDCEVARLLEDGLTRSPSLAGLVERVGELKGLVFIRLIDQTHVASAAGGLLHDVATAGDRCLLHIVLVRDYAYGDRTIATLGHELQHAVEVLEHPEARSEAAVDRLYRQIG